MKSSISGWSTSNTPIEAPLRNPPCLTASVIVLYICRNDTTPEDVTLSIPAFSTRAVIRIFLNNGGTVDCITYWFTKGQTDSTGHYAVRVTAGATNLNATIEVLTNSSQQIQVVNSVSNINLTSVDTDSYFFPKGI